MQEQGHEDEEQRKINGITTERIMTTTIMVKGKEAPAKNGAVGGVVGTTPAWHLRTKSWLIDGGAGLGSSPLRREHSGPYSYPVAMIGSIKSPMCKACSMSASESR